MTKKFTCSNTNATDSRETCAMPWKETYSAAVIVGFTFSFWRREHQCFTMETAGRLCVPPKLLGDSYRESICQSLWLQSCPAERSHCQTADNLTFLRPISRPLLSPLWTCFKHCRAAGPGALCGLRSTKRISVWTLVLKLTQAIENTVCVISESWWWRSRISVLDESLETLQNKCRQRLLCKSFVLVILTFPMIPAAN